jgi:hypothetical protein
MNLLYGILFLALGHIGAFFQLNGQLQWDWFKDNEWVIAACGFILSFFYIWGTKYTVAGMDGLLWPTRFIGFGIGIIIYAIRHTDNIIETNVLVTLISLGLCLILISIQVFWKV